MSAPDRIWAWKWEVDEGCGQWQEQPQIAARETEYVRADIAADLLAALEAAVDCGMVPKSTAKNGGASSHASQAHVADQIRAAIARAKGAA